jgi:hypothetical protein
VIDAVQRVLLRVFRVLPRRVRRWIVRFGTPKYTVGAICIVQRRDGAILLVRHSYAPRWGTPGGLAKRREPVDIAAARETLEEVNLAVELIGEPVVVVEPGPPARRRRVPGPTRGDRGARRRPTELAGDRGHSVVPARRAAGAAARDRDRPGGARPRRTHRPGRIGPHAIICPPDTLTASPVM